VDRVFTPAANEALQRRYGNWRGEMERRGASAS
jgi:hypothetical protein